MSSFPLPLQFVFWAEEEKKKNPFCCACLQYELATGKFPYPKWNSVFDQLTQVVKGEPPQLSNSEERQFSPMFINFVNLW